MENGKLKIENLPDGWQIKKFKFIADSFKKGNGITREQVHENGDTPCIRYGEIYSTYDKVCTQCVSRTNKDELDSLQYISKGDILFACTGELVEEIGKNIVYLGDEPCLAGGDIIVAKHSQNPVFLNYEMNSIAAQNQKSFGKTKLKVVHISAAEIGNVLVALPPQEQQKKIADFLDAKCSELQAAIDNTKQTIEEYKKLKQAVITKAVTKGLEPNRKMKDSGIEWIGEIPDDWEVRRFGRTLNERSEKNNPIKSKERLSCSIDIGVTLYSEKTTNLDRFKDDFTQYKIAHVGDLVMNSMNVIVGSEGISAYYGCVSPAYYTYYDEVEGHYTARFCDYILKTKGMKRLLFSLGKGIYAIERGDDRVNTCRLKVPREDLKAIKIPLPELNEQKKIVEYLDNYSKQIDTLISQKEQFITELEKYKQSLIYEYVTGKRVLN